MAELNFNAENVDPGQGSFELLPPGKYPVQIIASEMRPTKSGNGQYLWLEMDITGGEHQGRKLWDRLQLQNTNAQAVEIANRALSQICHSVGRMAVSNSEQLHFLPMMARVKVKPGDGQYEAKNEIAGYMPISGASPVVPAGGYQQRTASPTQAAPAAAQNGAAKAPPPWKRTG